MSANSFSDANLAAAYEQFIVSNRVVCAIAALVAYEHLVTLKYEIDFLWRGKRNTATWIFLFNRYFLLVFVSFASVPFSPQILALLNRLSAELRPKSHCYNALAMKIINVLISGVILPVHAFSILRSFALLQGHAWRLPITCIIIVLALASTIFTTFIDLTESTGYVDDPVLGSMCYGNGYVASTSISLRVNAAGSAINVTSAVIILGITLKMTVRQVLRASSLGSKTTLSQIMLRDGSLFFLLNFINAIFAIAMKGVAATPQAIVLSILLSILPNILLSRFIINLRHAGSPAANSTANQHASRFSIPNLRMPTMDEVVGNLGEPLDFVEYRVEDDSDDAQIDHLDSDSEQQGARTASYSKVRGRNHVEAVVDGVHAER